MATRNYVPRANGEGSIGTKKKHWGGAFFDNLAVKTLEVIGGGAENDAQPATVGWVKQGFSKLLKSALEISGCRVVTERTGYICFGKFFGGLKIQWGTMTANGQYNAFPVAFETTVRKCFFSNASSQTNENAYLFVEAGGFRSDKFGTGVLAFRVTDGATDTSKETDWVAIGF